MPQLLAKFVPLVQTLILVGIDVRARSRFDRFTHHAHGHGGWIAAGGDVGSRFPVARSVDDGASATGVCIQMYTRICLGVKRPAAASGGGGTRLSRNPSPAAQAQHTN